MRERRRGRARRVARLTALLVGALAAAVLAAGGCRRADGPAQRYHCPMHPTYVSDRQGDCPICGMRLVPIAGDQASPGGPAAGPTAAIPPHPEKWNCVMCPGVLADGPGRCPECGMRLQAPDPHAAPVPGLAAVPAAAAGLELAGARTATARVEPLFRAIRTVGTVKADETRVRRVQARVGGWVEQLHVDFTGRRVRAGEPLLSLYSPELLASQEEFLRAREAAARFAASDLPEVRRGGEDLLRAARRRLELFDVPGEFIERLEHDGRPSRAVTLVAPFSGHVTARGVLAGQRIEPETELFTITDLSRVWVEAQFYEADAALVREGQAVALTLPFDPSLRVAGSVAYVYPWIEGASRTLPVRFDIANPDLRLRPGMFADVELRVDLGEQLVVPDDAVMDTGREQYVFVAGEDGGFVPRAVRVGVRGDGLAQVLSGLRAGERVAVRANFLIDSESRLRAVLGGGAAGAAAGTGHAHGGTP